MRRHRRLTAGLGVFLASAVALAGVAFADQVANNLDGSVDGDLETMALTAGGSTGSTVLRIIEQNDDGKQGCNLTGGKVLTVSVSSSDTAVATVSPSSLTFDSCGATRTVTVTPVSAGTSNVTLTQTANTTSGSFDLRQASFRVAVASAADPCAGRNSPAAPSISEPNAATKSTSGWYNAGSGLAQFEVSPATNAEYSLNGGTTWTAYTAAVTLGEGQHSVIARNHLPATSSPACARVDGSQSLPTVINVDRTAPGATPASVTSTSWRNTSLSETFTFSDTLSGLASGQGLDADNRITLTASAESLNASTPTVASATIYDVAGNSTARSVSALIDLTDPTVELTGGPEDGASYYFGFVPAAPGCTASDGLSGLADAESSTAGHQDCTVTGYSTAVGSRTVTASARDNAGNTDSDSHSYTVLAWGTGTGFKSPVTSDLTKVNTVRAGSTVPLKFNVFAGTTEITDVTMLGAVWSFVGKSCQGSDTPVEINEFADAGTTALRYEDGQFIRNWKTPTSKGCGVLTVTLADGSTISADFKLK